MLKITGELTLKLNTHSAKINYNLDLSKKPRALNLRVHTRFVSAILKTKHFPNEFNNKEDVFVSRIVELEKTLDEEIGREFSTKAHLEFLVDLNKQLYELITNKPYGVVIQ